MTASRSRSRSQGCPRGALALWRRAGFSLIELLIVVAIIAALVGVAVPMFQKNIGEAHTAKARGDLDTIRNAIAQHDTQNRPLIGTRLAPLLGRYLQDLPKDPWGNDYLLDAGVGIVITFGADQKAGGNDEDGDLLLRYKADLQLIAATLDGAWGPPRIGYRLRLTFNKPFDFLGGKTAADVIGELGIITDYKNVSGGYKLLSDAAAWGTWVIESCDPVSAEIRVKCTAEAAPGGLALTPSLGANMAMSTTGPVPSSVMLERYTTGGPLDPVAYGSGVIPLKTLQPIPLVQGENRGVLLKRK